MLQTWVINSSIPSVGVREFKPRTNSLPCNIHRVTFKNVKRLFDQSEAEKLGQSMTMHDVIYTAAALAQYVNYNDLKLMCLNVFGLNINCSYKRIRHWKIWDSALSRKNNYASTRS